MPSGPKKRRAARNKKEKENININLSSTNNPIQGNDDLKSKNEKGSDGGEYNSHTSAARPIASEVMSAKESCLESGNPGVISNGESLAEKNSKDDEFVKSDDSSPSNMAAVKETGSKSAAEDSTNSVKTAASVSEVEKSNTRSVFLENSVAPLQEVIDLAGRMNEDSVYPSTNENAKTSSFEEPNPKESDIKVLTPSSASPLNKFTNGAVHTKNSETPKSSKNQPSVSLTPNLVKKTSWLSCCGMFEILSGSNR
ncbi:hypothetical protein MtrunA17_Chr6g0478041 [Medicago truncatula]|uniref:Uncharacterized protein n=1 Tax=Medicago truncatula TaxID=3880 RepID=A0A396HK31_MEDTR|nr:hyphally regulated cell wall protein 3 [Medicago truncatula]RHN52214.1 hypothetical protein MtrunA17_Chr6g0478041 [Medicago truncatula]